MGLLITLGVLTGFVSTLWAAVPHPPAWPPLAEQVEPHNPSLPVITRLELRLFSHRYDAEPLLQRLARIETTIYGEPRPQLSNEQRIAALEKVFAQQRAPLAEEETKPPPAKSAAASPTAPTEPENAPKKREEESSYPVLTAIEQKVLGKVFEDEDISARLNRVEGKVYGHRQQGTLMDRMDGLRLRVLGDLPPREVPEASPYGAGPPPYYPYAPPAHGYAYAPYPPPGVGGYGYYPPPPHHSGGYAPPPPGYPPPAGPHANVPNPAEPTEAYQPGLTEKSDVFSNPNYESPYANTPNYPSVDDLAGGASGQSPDLLAALNQVEKKVLRKTYPTEDVDARLARLENKVFHQTAPPGVSHDDRLQRIIAVAAAGGDKASSTTSTTKSSVRSILPMILMLIPLILL